MIGILEMQAICSEVSYHWSARQMTTKRHRELGHNLFGGIHQPTYAWTSSGKPDHSRPRFHWHASFHSE